jgi:hypothetical protein
LQGVGARRCAARLARVGAKHDATIASGTRAHGDAAAGTAVRPRVNSSLAATAGNPRVNARIRRRPISIIITAGSTERDCCSERKSMNADR